jgi:nucleotidyltransferase substrate binding protein (TIGR01987 family)
MKLDLTSLINAITALEKSVNSFHTLSTKDIITNDDIQTLKAGVIQNFEVAYELCWKFIQRWLRENRTIEESDSLITKKDIFRLAAKYNLIERPEPWFEFGEKRNLSSHIYNMARRDCRYKLRDNIDIAKEVFQSALLFVKEARSLQTNLEMMNEA